MKSLKIVMFLLGAIVLCVVFLRIALQYNAFGDLMLKSRASDTALLALQSTPTVNVTSDKWYRFTPTNQAPTTALVFYPCALCDTRAFAPLMHRIAEQGFLVVLVPMPSNFAIFATDTIVDVQADYPQIKQWVLSGHSMGGGAAAMFASEHADKIAGLLMWDSYTHKNYAVTNKTLAVTVIHGSAHHDPERDRVFTEAKTYLPPQTQFITIKGGDHFQFGDFNAEDLAGRMTATISKQQQHQQIINASVDFLRTL